MSRRKKQIIYEIDEPVCVCVCSKPFLCNKSLRNNEINICNVWIVFEMKLKKNKEHIHRSTHTLSISYMLIIIIFSSSFCCCLLACYSHFNTATYCNNLFLPILSLSLFCVLTSWTNITNIEQKQTPKEEIKDEK